MGLGTIPLLAGLEVFLLMHLPLFLARLGERAVDFPTMHFS